MLPIRGRKRLPPAMINLGYVAERGTPGHDGFRGAARWYERAGKSGDGQGWFKLYQVQSVDRGDLPRDLASAHQHLRQAAELGHPAAQWTLGQLLLKGEGMPADGQAAVEWFHRLTLQKADPRLADSARIELGKMYRDHRLKRPKPPAATSPRRSGSSPKWRHEATVAPRSNWGKLMPTRARRSPTRRWR